MASWRKRSNKALTDVLSDNAGRYETGPNQTLGRHRLFAAAQRRRSGQAGDK
jgi:hypothetical protein